MNLGRSYRLFEVAGIPVFMHWSALLMFALLCSASVIIGGGLAIAATALFLLMLLHELGHAFMAHRFGYGVLKISLFPFVGLCHYQQPYSDYEDAVIAWGGVLAQLLVLVPAVLTLALFGNSPWGPINVVLIVFTYVNTVMLVLNLIPARGLDGVKAWRLLLIVSRAKYSVYELRRKRILK